MITICDNKCSFLFYETYGKLVKIGWECIGDITPEKYISVPNQQHNNAQLQLQNITFIKHNAT